MARAHREGDLLGCCVNNWKKDIVTWKVGTTLYISVVFTWQMKEAEQIAVAHRGTVIAGGPAVALMGARWAKDTPQSVPFDVLSFHNPCATFTTRGCIRQCPFCIVPRIEGDFVELKDWKPAPVVCDNNFLAASRKHISKAIDRLCQFCCVDFNQGLDARKFNTWNADELSRLPRVILRFAFDNVNQESTLVSAVRLAHRKGFKDIRVFVLIGFKDTPDDALYRLEFVRSLGALPNPMRYQPLDAPIKNGYVATNWTEYKLQSMMRYYSRLNWLGGIDYADYRHGLSSEDRLRQCEMTFK